MFQPTVVVKNRYPFQRLRPTMHLVAELCVKS